MGYYIQCSKCEKPQLPPWDLPLIEIVSYACNSEHIIRCEYCNTIIPYDRAAFIAELADIIEKLIEKENKS